MSFADNNDSELRFFADSNYAELKIRCLFMYPENCYFESQITKNNNHDSPSVHYFESQIIKNHNHGSPSIHSIISVRSDKLKKILNINT